jgi:hypothetical protein
MAAAAAAVEAVRRAVRADQEGVLLLQEACGALAMLADGNGDDAAASRSAMVQAGAPAALVAAVYAAVRAGYEVVLQLACVMLAQLTSGDGADGAASRAALVQAGAPVALVAAAQEAGRAGNAQALEAACTALANMLDESDERQAALVQAGATPALRDRLQLSRLELLTLPAWPESAATRIAVALAASRPLRRVHVACPGLLAHIAMLAFGSELVPLQGWATADGFAMALARLRPRAETRVRDLLLAKNACS